MTTATEAWLAQLQNIVTNGIEENTRGMKTKELINQTIKFDMETPIIYHEKRKLNYQFMAAEAEFIANGDNRVSSLSRYNKNIAQFSDDGLIFNGNYGDPFNSQLNYVVKSLVDLRESRQAVLTIWQANPVKSNDTRCTLTMQFLIRDGYMDCVVNMRSSDIVWGIGYDLFNFTIMALRVLTLYNTTVHVDSVNIVQLGSMYLNAGSSHLYERHYDLAESILEHKSKSVDILVPIKAYSNWNYIAHSLVACKENTYTEDMWQLNPLNIK